MKASDYRRLCRWVDQAAGHGRRSRQQFSDAVIVKVYFWATCNDLAVSGACDVRQWPAGLADEVAATLPSQSTMSRRLRSVGVLQLIERLQLLLAENLRREYVVKVIDSKPLAVGNYSKDRDARRGRAAGAMARGYKLHALTAGQAFLRWTLTAMNVSDQTAAGSLLATLGRGEDAWGYVVADNGYDANALHERAASANHQLLAPPRKSNEHVRDVRRNTPQRIRSLDLCAQPLRHAGVGESFGKDLLRYRGQIERNLGNATMSGLRSPPPWVRRPHRLAPWAAAKIIQRMLRQLQIEELRT